MNFNNIKKLFCNLNEAKKGYKVFKKISKVYPGYVICVNQHPSLGDSYLMALYLPQYFKEHKYVVTTIGSSSADVYRYMNIADIVVLDQCQTDQLISFTRMNGIESNTVKILHHQALKWHIGIAWQFQGVNGLNFAGLIESVVFKGLDKSCRKYPPKIDFDEEFFVYKGLIKGRSTILFPYTSTLPSPPKEFWIRVVEKLKKNGKRVYTFTWNDEKPIDGTSGIKFEIKEIVAAAEYAGEIISARSGLSDILSFADCKQTIIYPSGGADGWIHGSLKDFWSVVGFGYCNDAIEITFDL